VDKLRLGMIGTGGRGGMYKLWKENPRVEVIAGADVNPKARQEFAQDLPAAFVTDDYRRVLERKDVDAVAVCTPDWLHRQHATAALQAGKHVFCEKPLAITVEDCDDILRAWQKSGKRMMVGFNMRYAYFVVKMKELIDAGVVGQLKTAWTRHFVGWGGRFYYHDWHAKRQHTTSLLLQKGTHDLDVMHWICGTHATRVSAFGRLAVYGGDKPDDLRCRDCDIARMCLENSARWHAHDDLCVFRKEVDVEDVSVVNMEYANGMVASYMECHFSPDYERNYTFIGTEGRIESDEPEGKVYLFRRIPGKNNTTPEVIECPSRFGGHGGADPQIAGDFVNVVLDGVQPRAPVVAGRWSVAAGVCAAKSLRNGGAPVDVPPLPDDLKHLGG
jgi:predicted dehydrogenase